MERTQIYLSRDEHAALERESQATGRSKSQLIREAIDRVYVAGGQADLLGALERSHGRWRRRESGAEWVEERRPGRLALLYETSRARRH